ncbi:hypothetical protein U0070_027090 [Myodes glareolus]|uniref:NKG2-D type II integral membrane protein n=1 Tax=Myodes glareolus TaxID=447135 RepID=A0AAW0H9P9_MYOGA
MSKYNNYKLRPTSRDASPGQQKQRSALPTSKPRENVSPLFVTRIIAAAMAIRFLIITLIWFTIFLTSKAGTRVKLRDFFKLVKSYHWMGLFQTQANGSWQWEDGSTLSPNELTLVEMQRGSCAVYGSSFKAYTEDCSTLNTYICMKKAVEGLH